MSKNKEEEKKFYIMTEVDPQAIILVTLQQYGKKGVKISDLRKETGLRKSFTYARIDELEKDKLIESFKKPKIKGRFFRLTNKGKKHLALLGHSKTQK